MSLDEILDYRKINSAIEEKDGFTIGHNRNRHKKEQLKDFNSMLFGKMAVPIGYH